MTLRTNLLIAGSAGAGIGFGVTMAILMLGAWDVSTSVRNVESPETKQAQVPHPNNSGVWEKMAEQRLRNLESEFSTLNHSIGEYDMAEQRLRNLENKFSMLNRSVGEHNAENGSFLMDDEYKHSITNNTPLDPIEDWNRVQSEWQSKLQAHDTDYRDSAWSAASEDNLWNGLEELASSVNFELESIDCRTTTCTAQTRWPSHDSAKLGLGAMLGHNYQEDCGVEIVLPEEATGIDSYLATILIVCESEV